MSAYLRREIADRQRYQQIYSAIKQDQHTLVQMNAKEFIDFYVHYQLQHGQTYQAIFLNMETSLREVGAAIPENWNQIKSGIKTGTGLIPWGMDVLALTAIAMEMKRGGNTFAKFKINTHAGKPYIVFEGYSGLRRHLTGTRYLANNPKVVSFGIGKLGAAQSIKSGFVLTVIISAAFHGFEQLLNDQATWHDFVGGVAVDVGVAAAASGIAWGAVATYVGGAAAMAAVGPMLAVVVVGAALTLMTMSFIDSDSLSKKIADSLREAEHNLKNGLLNISNEIHKTERMYREDPVGFMHRLFGIPYFGNNYR